MATLPLQNSYRCDQCGTPEIVAVPVLYQQGTRSFSGLFNHGTSQSYSAQAAAPPRARGYIRPFLLWGFFVVLFSISSFFDLSALLARPTIPTTEIEIAGIFLSLWLASVGGLAWGLRRIYSYKPHIHPQLRLNWATTHIGRRCGRFNLIPS